MINVDKLSLINSLRCTSDKIIYRYKYIKDLKQSKISRKNYMFKPFLVNTFKRV